MKKLCYFLIVFVLATMFVSVEAKTTKEKLNVLIIEINPKLKTQDNIRAATYSRL